MNIEQRPEKILDFMTLPERAAMGKVSDIHKERFLKHAFIRFDPVHPSIDRLRENLPYIEVAANFAQNSENFFFPKSVANNFEAAILMYHRLPQKIPREEVYTILIKDGLVQGIVLVDKIRGGPRTIISQCVDFNSSTMQETVDITVREMLLIYKDMYELCVPIYGLTGSLYWPDEMSYRDVQAFARVRKIYGI